MRATPPTGRLVNLMSNDAGIVMEQSVRMTAPMLTALPQVIVVLVLLFRELGVPMFAGFVFMMLSVPFSGVVFAKIGINYGQAAHQADARLKFTNDFFAGIRVVKAYAWEKAFMKVILKTRLAEVKFIRKHAYWSMLGMMCIYMQLPQLMQFSVYTVFVASDGEFSAARIFTVIQLFQLLTQPLTQLPSALNQLATLRAELSAWAHSSDYTSWRTTQMTS